MNRVNSKIWAANGELLPIEYAHEPVRDVAIVIVNRNRRDLTDYLCKQILSFNNPNSLTFDLYVVDIGSEPAGRSSYTTIEYVDTDFRGKCYAHNVGIRQAALAANYRYYWAMMNDLRFDDQPDAMTRMVEIMDANPELGLLSPTNIGVGKQYPGASPREGQDFRKVPVCDYLAHMVRSEVVREVGFLNPEFRYCWGAIHELSYKIYRTKKWSLAYCDRVYYEHLGGTTYGKTKGVVTRAEYINRAKRFAAEHFITHYGADWDRTFTAMLPPDVTERGVYSRHRNLWQSAFSRWELSQLMSINEGPDTYPRQLLQKVKSLFVR